MAGAPRAPRFACGGMLKAVPLEAAMSRALILAYGIVAYVLFLLTFLYAIGFVAGVVVPKTIDSGIPGALVPSIVVNLVLLSVFALQHSVMARPAFKRWWTRIVPAAAERSTYVLLSSLALILIFWQWRPMPEPVWSVTHPAGRAALLLVEFGGWGLVLVATFLIDHFDLFGLRQVWLNFQGRPYAPPAMIERGAYKACRHPIMLGFLVAFWATPHMSWGRLLFAAVTTAYVLVAIRLEERDLVASLGQTYDEYRRRVPMLLPLKVRRKP